MKPETKQKVEDAKTNVSVWWYGVKWNARNKWNATVKWCEEHPELALAAIPAVLTAAKGVSHIARSVDRKADLKREQELKDRYGYDRSLGIYHKLRRPLRTSEAIEIDRRKANGESMISILSSMRLLD